MDAERPLTEQEERAWRAYHRLSSQLSARIGRELIAETGLSDSDVEILLELVGTPDHTVRALSLRSAVNWEKSRLSHHLARMERRGLVRRETCEEDGRGAVIRLTPEGREAMTGACCARARAIRRHLLDRLTTEQVEALIEIAETVLEPPP